MATNAIINVEGFHVCTLYKHYDGDTMSTLPWLEKFNQEFTEKRGHDPEYKMAQLIRSSALMAEEFSLDKSTETGWGMLSFTTEAEFVYTLMKDGTVKVATSY